MADLGNFLNRAGGTPQTGRPVTFDFGTRNRDGFKVMHRVSATLLPVDPVEKREAFDDAADELDKNRSGTSGDLEHERVVQLLARALRDPDDLRKRFVSAENIAAFRTGLQSQQMRALFYEYEHMLLDQYPLAFSVQERDAILKRAEDFFEPSPAKPSDTSPGEAPLPG